MGKETAVVLMMAMAIFLLAVAWIFIFLNFRYQNNKNKENIILSKKNVKVRWMHASYAFFSEFALTKSYVRRIRRRYEILEPSELSRIDADTMATAYAVWGISGIAFFACMLVSFSFYMAFVGCVLVYVTGKSVLEMSISKKEKELIRQLDVMLNGIRHNYYANGGAVCDAIEEALADAPFPINIHMERIYDILNSADMDEEVAKYNESVPNRFLKAFLANCVNIIRFDDCKVGDTPLFIRNLNSLKEEMDIEIRKRELIEHKLGGNTPLVIIPMCCLELIRQWAVGNMPELASYYDGAYGLVASAAICLISLFIYYHVEQMKEMGIRCDSEHAVLSQIMEIPIVRRVMAAKTAENYGKALGVTKQLRQMGETLTVEQFYIKKYAYALAGFLLGLGFLLSANAVRRESILKSTEGFEATDMIIYETEVMNAVESEVLSLSRRFKDTEGIDTAGLKDFISSQELLGDDFYMETVEQLVKERVRAYQNIYFKWWYVLLCFACMAAGYRLPDYALRVKKKLVEMEMENEMIQFQSIILMLMHIERVSSRDILEQLEQFATVFRSTISTCVDNFNDGELDAMRQMKKDESAYPPFVRMVDNLIMADESGIRNSFEEVEGDRKSFQEKRKQDNAIYIDRQHSLLSVLAFIPMGITVGLYLIAPMCMECLSQFLGFSGELSTFI